jgi:hypothetical protein
MPAECRGAGKKMRQRRLRILELFQMREIAARLHGEQK